MCSYEIPQIQLKLQEVNHVGVDVQSSVRAMHEETTVGLRQLSESMLPCVQKLNEIHAVLVDHPTAPTISLSRVVEVDESHTRTDVDLPSEEQQPVKRQACAQNTTQRQKQCSCNCHVSMNLRTPALMAQGVGTLQVQCARGSWYQACGNCERRQCYRYNGNIWKSEYYFPTWLFHRMLSFRWTWNPRSGYSISLRTPRLVPTNSELFLYAQHGNIEGMQRLFDTHAASPFDISQEEGRSALHVSARDNDA